MRTRGGGEGKRWGEKKTKKNNVKKRPEKGGGKKNKKLKPVKQSPPPRRSEPHSPGAAAGSGAAHGPGGRAGDPRRGGGPAARRPRAAAAPAARGGGCCCSVLARSPFIPAGAGLRRRLRSAHVRGAGPGSPQRRHRVCGRGGAALPQRGSRGFPPTRTCPAPRAPPAAPPDPHLPRTGGSGRCRAAPAAAGSGASPGCGAWSIPPGLGSQGVRGSHPGAPSRCWFWGWRWVFVPSVRRTMRCCAPHLCFSGQNVSFSCISRGNRLL